MEAEDIDAVVIATYNDSHVPIAIEAARRGKHVHSEKPLGMSGAQAEEAVRVINETGVIAAVAFNCCKHPLQEYVKRLIASGELGEVISFRGASDQDYYLDDNWHTQDFVWRMTKKHAGSGALGDLAAHTISLSQYLIGDTAEVSGTTKIIFPERPDFYDPDKIYKVENDDIVQYTYRYKMERWDISFPAVWRRDAKWASIMRFN
ncbi:Inositol 2-dehydrogenase/D-chiro-inositol 3-dehydrogenase [bioreactor metagenome]|uniref:Inositol 2-dehydrogenase/D-chiro-inositol 3-dehydrogenase n=1 Tax=bioreactor metagenome TaxID=1076179 RepID=A0A645HNN9_9ZZZZ